LMRDDEEHGKKKRKNVLKEFRFTQIKQKRTF
jgi:hypothetical protein